MDTERFGRIARTTLRAHGLEGWKFDFDRAVNRFGVCRYSDNLITMSRALVEANDEATCMNTLFHEIAHALVGYGHGHDYVWAAKCRELGGDGLAKYSYRDVTPPQKKWIVSCPGCGMKCQVARRRQGSICAHCHRKGAYAYPLVWKENPAA